MKSPFEPPNIDEILNQFANIGANAGFAGKHGQVPEAKKCATNMELAAWFSNFAYACRANLPKDRDAAR